MTKSMTTDLAPKEQKAIELRKRLQQPVRLEGEEDGDSRPPITRICQSQTKSAHPPGSLIVAATDELVAPAPQPFAP